MSMPCALNSTLKKKRKKSGGHPIIFKGKGDIHRAGTSLKQSGHNDYLIDDGDTILTSTCHTSIFIVPAVVHSNTKVRAVQEIHFCTKTSNIIQVDGTYRKRKGKKDKREERERRIL